MHERAAGPDPGGGERTTPPSAPAEVLLFTLSSPAPRAVGLEILRALVLTLLAFALVAATVQTVVVDGESMQPALAPGQYLLVNKLAYVRADQIPLVGGSEDRSRYLFGGPRRGDLVVFRFPGVPERELVKRLVALPGEEVEIVRGQVFVDGRALAEPYLAVPGDYSYPRQRIPAGQYFVLGDNRPESNDSHLGWLVPAERLVGRAWLSLWPPGRWGALAAPAYGE